MKKTITLLLICGYITSFTQITPCFRLKTSLNAYSFNAPLTKGEMDIIKMLEYCADNQIDAVDITGYYFPEYPKVPSDEYIYAVKRKAFQLGVAISGTGVRTDFTSPDKVKRNEHIQLVKNWIEVAEKLGAPVIRIFAGNKVAQGDEWFTIAEWMVKDIKECVDFGKKHGVVVAVQNHADFIQTPQHIQYLIEKVNDPWFGLILDTGSYRTGDPYDDITKTIKYAVNWQIKEKIFVNGKEVETDYKKLFDIIKANCYRGYIPIETLGEGDPKVKIKAMLALVRKHL
jgi:sugar phosphate isomerase/epimerase